MAAGETKFLVEVTVKKNDGKKVDEDEILDALVDAWDGETHYIQGSDNDEETEYEVTMVRRAP